MATQFNNEINIGSGMEMNMKDGTKSQSGTKVYDNTCIVHNLHHVTFVAATLLEEPL